MLVHYQLDMVGGEWSTEEGLGTYPLVQDGAKPGTRCVAVNDNWALEVRHLQDRLRRECPLEGSEGLVCLRYLDERLLPQEAREGCCDGANVVDKLAVVAREP